MPAELDRHLTRQRQLESRITTAAAHWADVLERCILLAHHDASNHEYAQAQAEIAAAESHLVYLVGQLRGALAGRKAHVSSTPTLTEQRYAARGGMDAKPTDPHTIPPLSPPLIEPKPYAEMATAWRNGTLDNPLTF